MSTPNKAILINGSVIVALVYQYWKGISLFLLVVAGIFLLVLANLLMIFAVQSRHDIGELESSISMSRLLQLAAMLLLILTGAAATNAQFFKHKEKKPKANVEWLWQYGPPPAEGRENALVLDPRFRPFLAQYLTAPQTFWGNPKTGYKPLAETALDFLSVPDKVLADDNRYLSITGCVFRFCPARGLLWADLGLQQPLIAFAAIDWVKESKVPSDPDAEYTMWIFSNLAIDPAHIPSALTRSIARWTAQPSPGSTVTQKITNAILVDPDGQPHPIPPASIGANTLTQPQTEQKEKP